MFTKPLVPPLRLTESIVAHQLDALGIPKDLKQEEFDLQDYRHRLQEIFARALRKEIPSVLLKCLVSDILFRYGRTYDKIDDELCRTLCQASVLNYLNALDPHCPEVPWTRRDSLEELARHDLFPKRESMLNALEAILRIHSTDQLARQIQEGPSSQQLSFVTAVRWLGRGLARLDATVEDEQRLKALYNLAKAILFPLVKQRNVEALNELGELLVDLGLRCSI